MSWVPVAVNVTGTVSPMASPCRRPGPRDGDRRGVEVVGRALDRVDVEDVERLRAGAEQLVGVAVDLGQPGADAAGRLDLGQLVQPLANSGDTPPAPPCRT